MVRVTVFTGAYNRAYCIDKLYESLRRQTLKDFLWLIIDDGSTDDTQEKVKSWQNASDNGFEIIYLYKENGGLQSVYNIAIGLLETELAVAIDSDDYMPDNAIERILEHWDKYGNGNYAGIAGLDYYTDGTLVGDKIKAEFEVDITSRDYILKSKGDKKLVVRSDLYKSVAPMKEFPGEKISPHYLHLLIGKKYKFLVMNENLCFVDYRPDGMTSNIWKQYRSSPNAFMAYRQLEMTLGLGLKRNFELAIHYTSSCILAHKFCRGIMKSPKKLLSILAIPFGLVMSLIVRIKARKRK